MKRLPLISSLFAFALFCISLSYWGLQWLTPHSRSVALPVQSNALEPASGQWGSLFGLSQSQQPVASNYQLKGVILAKHAAHSLAIISANGKPGIPLAAGQDIAPGVQLKEITETAIVIIDNGVSKRIELPQNKSSNGLIAISTPADLSSAAVVAPPAFPPHTEPAAHHVPAAPMVTPGFPVASLPAVMPGASQ